MSLSFLGSVIITEQIIKYCIGFILDLKSPENTEDLSEEILITYNGINWLG